MVQIFCVMNQRSDPQAKIFGDVRVTCDVMADAVAWAVGGNGGNERPSAQRLAMIGPRYPRSSHSIQHINANITIHLHFSKHPIRCKNTCKMLTIERCC